MSDNTSTKKVFEIIEEATDKVQGEIQIDSKYSILEVVPNQEQQQEKETKEEEQAPAQIDKKRSSLLIDSSTEDSSSDEEGNDWIEGPPKRARKLQLKQERLKLQQENQKIKEEEQKVTVKQHTFGDILPIFKKVWTPGVPTLVTEEDFGRFYLTNVGRRVIFRKYIPLVNQGQSVKISDPSSLFYERVGYKYRSTAILFCFEAYGGKSAEVPLFKFDERTYNIIKTLGDHKEDTLYRIKVIEYCHPTLIRDNPTDSIEYKYDHL